jgi:hypothetical protein
VRGDGAAAEMGTGKRKTPSHLEVETPLAVLLFFFFFFRVALLFISFAMMRRAALSAM